jgi:hypothetical protein
MPVSRTRKENPKEISMKANAMEVWLVPSLAIALICCLPISTQAQGEDESTTGRSLGTQTASQPTKEALIGLEQEDWEEAKKKDWKAYDRLLSEDFVWVDENGVVAGRVPFVRYFADLDLKDYAMEDVKVTMFSKDVALLTYKVTEKGTFRGSALPPTPSYVSSEYIRRGGKWVNVFTQTTGAK